MGVETVQADLATTEGNDALLAAVQKTGRPVAALLANAGRGLGRAFLEQDWLDIDKLIDTNIAVAHRKMSEPKISKG